MIIMYYYILIIIINPYKSLMIPNAMISLLLLYSIHRLKVDWIGVMNTTSFLAHSFARVQEVAMGGGLR